MKKVTSNEQQVARMKVSLKRHIRRKSHLFDSYLRNENPGFTTLVSIVVFSEKNFPGFLRSNQ